MKKHLFLVALHVKYMQQAIEQSQNILFEGGADGVLLVNNGGHVSSTEDDYPDLFIIATEVKRQYPDKLIGINPLDLTQKQALRRFLQRKDLDILWTDDAGVYESGNYAYLDELVIEQIEGLKKLKRKYFGGISFKYQPQPKNLDVVARVASTHFTVITSGEKTGSAPSIEKIMQIRKAITKARPLGIASGITAENIKTYLPYVDIFIVGTSLCMGNGFGNQQFYYEPHKVHALAQKIRDYVQ